MKRYFITGNARDEAGGSYNDKHTKKDEPVGKEKPVKDEDKKKDEKHSTFRDALQQWSNDNERDIAEDNSTPLRSNL